MQEITIYCDGACSGNPGPGGFGYIIKKSCKSAEFKGGSPATTNNRMELIAAIKAIEKIKHHSKITVVSDSQYLVKGMTEWIFGWQKRGWINSQKDPVKNKDLWLKLLELSKKHKIEMPITAQIYQVIYERKDPKKAVHDLMTRSPKEEGFY